MTTRETALLLIATASISLAAGTVWSHLAVNAQTGVAPAASGPAQASLSVSEVRALVDQSMRESLFNELWKHTFHYSTFFESLDGFTHSGTASVDGGQLILAAESGKPAEVFKQPTWQGVATFSERSRFRTAFTMTNPTGATAFIMVGSRDGQGYGFKVEGGSLYGFTKNGAREKTVLIGPIDRSHIYNLEARYRPGSMAVFYVDRVERGMITDVLPSSAAEPNRALVDIYVASTEATPKSLQLSFFEYLQMRSQNY